MRKGTFKCMYSSSISIKFVFRATSLPDAHFKSPCPQLYSALTSVPLPISSHPYQRATFALSACSSALATSSLSWFLLLISFTLIALLEALCFSVFFGALTPSALKIIHFATVSVLFGLKFPRLLLASLVSSVVYPDEATSGSLVKRGDDRVEGNSIVVLGSRFGPYRQQDPLPRMPRYVAFLLRCCS
jgi:hypothetical protein